MHLGGGIIRDTDTAAHFITGGYPEYTICNARIDRNVEDKVV